jgi:IclR family acetate operon transcriptional repressor
MQVRTMKVARGEALVDVDPTLPYIAGRLTGGTVVASNGRSARQRQAERYSIGAVENALTLLGAIAERDVLGLGEAAEIAGVSKSTAYRLLATLEVAGLAERLPESGYRAGVEAVRWATRLLAGLDVRTVALPTLRRLREETGETVNLAILRDTSLVYVEILESPAAFRMADVPGAAVPIHATALGKAVAVHLEPQQLAAMLGPEPYERLTANTPTTWQAFNAALGPTRAQGFGVDMEEVSIGVACVGAAVLDGGRVVGAISVSAPRARMTDARIAQIGEMVRTMAGEVSERLGPHPSEISRSATSPR